MRRKKPAVKDTVKWPNKIDAKVVKICAKLEWNEGLGEPRINSASIIQISENFATRSSWWELEDTQSMLYTWFCVTLWLSAGIPQFSAYAHLRYVCMCVGMLCESVNALKSVYVYIYIHIYMSHICVYIYKEAWVYTCTWIHYVCLQKIVWIYVCLCTCV